MNTNIPSATATTIPTAPMQLTKVIPTNIGDQLCFPKFNCIHLTFPGSEQLKRNLARYRQKDVLLHLFEHANNFELSDAELHSKLFGEKQEGIRILWEYVNMMIQSLGGQEFLTNYPKDNDTFQVLTNFYERNGSLPLSAEKSIISLFRKMLMYDTEMEEVQLVQKSIMNTNTEIPAQEKKNETMDVVDTEDLPRLFISPAEKFMDEFNGSSKDLRGLFKIPTENKFEVNLHQQVCNTSKNQFESTNGECCLFGLSFTEDEQIGSWISRTNGRYKSKPMPKTCEGIMDVNKEKVCFNFLKSLEISNINKETMLLHPCVHEFWEEDEIRNSVLQYLVGWSKNSAVYAKESQKRKYQDEATLALKSDKSDEKDEIEVGFVDGLFEMYKLRLEIAKARADLISDSVLPGYRHKFGTFLFNAFLSFRSTAIDNLINEKRKELDLYKKMEASRIAYDFLIMQHATIKCILEKKYDELINVTIYDKFIVPYLNRRHSQYTIVALTRSCAVFINQELLLAFMVRKNNWIKKQKLDAKNKQDQQAQRLIKMQKPTALAIKEQVSVEVDEKLRKVASESTSKIPSAKKSKSNKHKTGLAQLISQSTKENKQRSEAAEMEASFEKEDGEEAGLIIKGLIKILANILNDQPKNMLTNPSLYEQN